MFEPHERQYLDTARVARLGTADGDGRPHVVPVCFTRLDDAIVTPVDEKPKTGSPDELQRSRDIRENPRVVLLVDHYTETWSELGWLQVRGTATHLEPEGAAHAPAVTALREKYDQYADHELEARPIIQITPGSVLSWGQLDRPTSHRW